MYLSETPINIIKQTNGICFTNGTFITKIILIELINGDLMGMSEADRLEAFQASPATMYQGIETNKFDIV